MLAIRVTGVLTLVNLDSNESVGGYEMFQFFEPVHDDFKWNKRVAGRDRFEHQKPSVHGRHRVDPADPATGRSTPSPRGMSREGPTRKSAVVVTDTALSVPLRSQ